MNFKFKKAIFIPLGLIAVLLSGPAFGLGFDAPAAGDTASSCRPRTAEDMEDFQAFFDQMPPGEPTLRVSGEVEVPHPGYRVDLVPAITTQPDSPDATLALQLEKEPLDGVFPQVISVCSVEYEKTGLELDRFDQVRIFRLEQDPVEVSIEDVY